MSNDLTVYLAYQAEQERLNKRISDIERAIAIKNEELQKLEEEKSDFVYQARENADIIRKMEAKNK